VLHIKAGPVQVNERVGKGKIGDGGDTDTRRQVLVPFRAVGGNQSESRYHLWGRGRIINLWGGKVVDGLYHTLNIERRSRIHEIPIVVRVKAGNCDGKCGTVNERLDFSQGVKRDRHGIDDTRKGALIR